METKNIVKVVLTKEEKTILNQATAILSNICDIYDTYWCKGCPLANICEYHNGNNIANLLDDSLDNIEVK